MATLLKEIESANEKFMKCYNDNDMTSLSSLYTEDCKLMPTGTDVLVGKDAVAATFGGVQAAGAKTVKLSIDEVGPLGPSDGVQLAFERSHYTFYAADGSVFDSGKYVVIWKQVKGQWLLYTDIFNTNKP